MKPATPEKDEGKVESLQERSARLEAEATRLMAGEPDPVPAQPAAEPEAAPGPDLTALQNELKDARDQTLRALAEVDNARKRAAREREDASRYAIAGFARDLVAVSDNLRRALEAVPADLATDDRVKALLEGIEATERELLKSFEKNGIRKIEPVGEIFNPNFHEVMFEAPGTGKAAGTIIQIIEPGYVLNDRLLRPARVGVAKNDGTEGPAHAIDQKV